MTLQTARKLVEIQDWFGAANRLYYAVYQIISALMLHEGVRIKSHSGAKSMFELHFIKTGQIQHGVNYTNVCQTHDMKVIMVHSRCLQTKTFYHYYPKLRNLLT